MRIKEKHWMKQSRQENLIYLVIWGLLFAAPILSLYVRAVGDDSVTFNWSDVFIVWRQYLPFLLLFLLHNFLLAPQLVYRRRRTLYLTIVAVVIAAFVTYQCTTRPAMHDGPPDLPEWPMEHRAPPMEHGVPPMEHGEPPMGKGTPPMEHGVPPMGKGTPPKEHGVPPMDNDGPSFHPDVPPIIGQHDILSIVVLILMFGANLGIKGYFRSLLDHKRLAELEKQNLEQQLEYLRYQINPHFFMNTLNNIHALVDIDPVKAQETIVELSKMMRFVLYEGDKRGVPLTKELEYISTYVKLMQLRYADKVKITLELPDADADTAGGTISPLILISFVENAFKHGVSYQHESFIDVKATVEDDMLHFLCRNSKADSAGVQPQQGGVGLANVKKRLDLLYEHDYELNIQDDADVYTVSLVIPVKPKT